MTVDEAQAALAACRVDIDRVDRELMALLNQRVRIVERIGDIKQKVGLGIYEPKREDAVYDNVVASNQGPMPSASARRIFERIIDEMRTIQRDRMQHPDQKREN